MLEEAEEMIAGARILSKVLGGAKVIFGIEETKWMPLRLSKKLAKEPGMEVVP